MSYSGKNYSGIASYAALGEKKGLYDTWKNPLMQSFTNRYMTIKQNEPSLFAPRVYNTRPTFFTQAIASVATLAPAAPVVNTTEEVKPEDKNPTLD